MVYLESRFRLVTQQAIAVEARWGRCYNGIGGWEVLFFVAIISAYSVFGIYHFEFNCMICSDGKFPIQAFIFSPVLAQFFDSHQLVCEST